VPVSPSFTQIVGPATEGGVTVGVATLLSIFFSLNILLGFFNLIPFPPLDGYGVLGLFTTNSGALRLQQLRMQMGGFAFLGLVIAWQVFDRFFPTLFVTGIRVFYAGYRFS
jgi:Zn-dependent protease